MPTRHEEVSQLSWHQLRRRYRAENLQRVRVVEGLGEGKHTGDRKGLPLAEAQKDWDHPIFTVNESRPQELEQELVDLARDARSLEESERVRFDHPSFFPHLTDIDDEKWLDAQLQDYISKGER